MSVKLLSNYAWSSFKFGDLHVYNVQTRPAEQLRSVQNARVQYHNADGVFHTDTKNRTDNQTEIMTPNT